MNYVIASYNGRNNRKHTKPSLEDVLRVHFKQLLKLQNSLKQITLMKAKTPQENHNRYYDLDDLISKFKIPVVIIEVENYGFSMGQWLKCYEKYQSSFDYYIFVEDDYCPNIDDFDKILLHAYTTKFKDNKGLLCSWVQGKHVHNVNEYPIHFEGVILISSNTLKIVYDNTLFENNPSKYLDLIDEKLVPTFNWRRQRLGYIGGYYQLSFSQLFTLSSIEHKDYLDVVYENKKLQFLYWGDDDSHNGGHVALVSKNDSTSSTVQSSTFNQHNIECSPFIPIQLC